MADRTETATLGGGCFWCLEAVFEQVEGVRNVANGYAGGHTPSPSYDDVCTGQTGHAEVVHVTFDPDRLPYRELLHIFFTLHDPTTRDRQGADVGSQYRSVVFHHSERQRATAEAVMKEVSKSGAWPDPLVTALEPFRGFHPAEAYHQGYYRRNPNQGYCRAVIAPKVAALRRQWAHRLRPAPPAS